MKDKHIVDIIDNASVASLTTAELEAMRAHAGECVSCRGAFEAAQLSALVIQERAQLKIEPSPFFQTRVLAAWREQQAVERVPAFVRLWKSASALVSSMALVTVALAAMSFIFPEQTPTVLEQTASAYSAESVIFDQGDEQLTYEQVLNTIYGADDEAK